MERRRSGKLIWWLMLIYCHRAAFADFVKYFIFPPPPSRPEMTLVVFKFKVTCPAAFLIIFSLFHFPAMFYARNKLNILALALIVVSINNFSSSSVCPIICAPEPALINSQRSAGWKRVYSELWWRSATLQGIAKRSFWPSQAKPSVISLMDERRQRYVVCSQNFFLFHDNFLIIENNWKPSIFPPTTSEAS